MSPYISSAHKSFLNSTSVSIIILLFNQLARSSSSSLNFRRKLEAARPRKFCVASFSFVYTREAHPQSLLGRLVQQTHSRFYGSIANTTLVHSQAVQYLSPLTLLEYVLIRQPSSTHRLALNKFLLPGDRFRWHRHLTDNINRLSVIPLIDPTRLASRTSAMTGHGTATPIQVW